MCLVTIQFNLVFSLHPVQLLLPSFQMLLSRLRSLEKRESVPVPTDVCIVDNIAFTLFLRKVVIANFVQVLWIQRFSGYSALN
jgi:hypothetical protein